MKMQPLGAYIVVRPIEYEKKTESGLILSDGARKKTVQRGRVLAVGPSAQEVRVEDVVFYQPGAGLDDGDGNLILGANTDLYAVNRE